MCDMSVNNATTDPTPMRAVVRIMVGPFRSRPAVLRLDNCTLTCEADDTQLFSVTPETAELYWPSLLHLRFGQGHFQVRTTEHKWPIIFRTGSPDGSGMIADGKLAEEWHDALRQHGFWDL